MKRDVAVRWAEMLLSNPDVRGTGRLAPDDNHRCCLGVLCEVLGYETPEYLLLPTEVAADAGLWSSAGHSRKSAAAASLVVMNDAGTVGFTEIALYIEKHSDDL